jgi:hypothetical protein
MISETNDRLSPVVTKPPIGIRFPESTGSGIGRRRSRS